jgi:hypothetical protein
MGFNFTSSPVGRATGGSLSASWSATRVNPHSSADTSVHDATTNTQTLFAL